MGNRTATLPMARWMGLLLLLPSVGVAWGIWRHGLLSGLRPDYLSFLALLVAAIAGVAALAWLALRRRWGAMAIPSALACVVLAAYACFAGLSAAIGAMVLGLAAIAAGSLLDARGRASPWSRALAGLALVAAVVGWLLPFPVHGTWVYRIAIVALLVLRRRAVAAQLRSLACGWNAVAREHPAWLVLAVAGAAMASLGLWLPSLNYDDNTTHLVLVDQLLADGYYRLDVSSHLWAVTAWANNVLHAVAALLVGHEARGALNALWWLLGMAGAWRLAIAIGGSRAAALAAAAIYASHPMSTHFASTMQTDGPIAVVLLHLAADLANGKGRLASPCVTGAMFGLLLGLKTSSMVYWLLPLAWLAWSAARHREWKPLLVLLATAVAVGGSSYAYAALVTGNPVFPFFNAFFQSPFMDPVDFHDVRWDSGVDWRAAWDLTFDTHRFGESYRGAAGIALLVMLPGVAAEIVRRRAGGWIACWVLFAAAFMFWQIQYMRYLFPALAILSTVGIVGLARYVDARLLAGLLAAVMAVNAAVMPNISWMARDNPWGRLVRGGIAEKAEIQRSVIPQRVLLSRLLARAPHACVLMTDRRAPFVGGSNGRVSVTGWYDPQLFAAREAANADAGGRLWRQVLQQVGASYVMLPTQAADTPLSRALAGLGFVRVDAEGAAELWASASPGQRTCNPRFLRERDQARRLLSLWSKH